MARPTTVRKIKRPPMMIGYKPFGMERCGKKPVCLKYEEFESVTLVDYQRLSQEKAAREMNVSRPTFTRLYNNALRIIAKAFAEGRCIEINGGNYVTDREWCRCNRCKKVIEAGSPCNCTESPRKRVKKNELLLTKLK